MRRGREGRVTRKTVFRCQACGGKMGPFATYLESGMIVVEWSHPFYGCAGMEDCSQGDIAWDYRIFATDGRLPIECDA